ncbi:glycosyltransferase family 4 protein [Thermococcus sp. 2319x1]|uniref:glycosyltransferase family 4 protein n=1 Tax=Thermococcus sp. 2319x1 TaxID=1674923 RepID=UPI001583F337|nr:glycosyltransferase family 4 protein [Thermococcus sp. 2319x1]
MKILIVTHQVAFNIYGGAEIQIEKITDGLAGLGVDVKLFDMWRDKIYDFDILHIFNPTMFPYESYFLTTYAKRSSGQTKVAVSPVFWLPYYVQGVKMPLILTTGRFLLKLGKLVPYFGPSYVKRTLELSDILLTNTSEEGQLVKKLFGLPRNKPLEVIPNGVDISFKHGDPGLFYEKYGIEDFILFVGRIEERKNVLRLIEAFNESSLDTYLVLIGKPLSREYYMKCKEKAGDNVLFLPPLPHGSDMLKSAYKAAKVVVLPSYYETPGLSALEGALAGANVVITKNGGTREYFRDYAWYVDPMDKNSIKKALVEAFKSPRNRELQKYVEKNFTWEAVVKKLLRVYESLLEGDT